MSFLGIPFEVLLPQLVELDDTSLLSFLSLNSQIKNSFPSQTLWQQKLTLMGQTQTCFQVMEKQHNWLTKYRFNLGIAKIECLQNTLNLRVKILDRSESIFHILKYVTVSLNGLIVFENYERFREVFLSKFRELAEPLPKYGYTLPKKSLEIIKSYTKGSV